LNSRPPSRVAQRNFTKEWLDNLQNNLRKMPYLMSMITLILASLHMPVIWELARTLHGWEKKQKNVTKSIEAPETMNR
jgi:hypothetical protein